jgi:hypothetical protein
MAVIANSPATGPEDGLTAETVGTVEAGADALTTGEDSGSWRPPKIALTAYHSARQRGVEHRFGFDDGDQDVGVFDLERFFGLDFRGDFAELLLGLEDEVYVRIFFDRQVDVVKRDVGFVFDADVDVVGHAFAELARVIDVVAAASA